MKSNVLEALYSLSLKVLRPLYATSDNEDHVVLRKKPVIEPFAFSKQKKEEPTEFEVFFRTELAEYRYLLSIKRDLVLYERLDRIKLDTGRKSALLRGAMRESF